jgi:hypothetical protein
MEDLEPRTDAIHSFQRRRDASDASDASDVRGSRAFRLIGREAMLTSRGKGQQPWLLGDLGARGACGAQVYEILQNMNYVE